MPGADLADLAGPGGQERLWMDDARQTAQSKLEHELRYHFAALFARHRDVLDIGTGGGYGAALIAKVARNVVGIDSCGDAVARCQQLYTAGNLAYNTCDALDLWPYDAYFDLATCFEVMEHVTDPAKLLSEASRILKPGGILILSVPFYDRSGPVSVEERAAPGANPHHLWTWERSGLTALLEGCFPDVRVMVQYMHTFAFNHPYGTSWIGICYKKENRDKERQGR